MTKNLLKWLLKLGLTVLALWLLSKKIDWEEVSSVIKQSNIWWLLMALGVLVLSKVTSSFRLNILQRIIPIHLSERKNLTLYFIGMFYNLFLPGGIGGDGYKGYYLKRQFDQPLKRIISALFLDRFYGLAALFILLFSGLLMTGIPNKLGQLWQLLIILLLLLVIPVTWMIIRSFFRGFEQPFKQVLGFSMIVQALQLTSAFLILQALGITENVMNYLVLFLGSSIAAVLPISVGGVGVRELVMVYGQQYFNIGKTEAVAFSLLFFILSAICSFFGAFLSMKENQTAS